MYKKILLAFIVAFIFLPFHAGIVNAGENGKEIDIATSPHKILFDIQNGRPSEVFTKELNIQNNGTKDFNYLAANHFLTGSEKLYNELLLTIKDKDAELFNGKLMDFKKLDSRRLKSNTSENLIFSIEIPLELGNEFQKLNSKFQFKFYVEGTLGGILPVDGPKLPSTATNVFNILVTGAVLVLTGSALQFMLKRRGKQV